VDTAALRDRGFDIVHAFSVHGAAAHPALEILHDPARPTAILVGNTRALWASFAAALAADPDLAASSDPIERYTEATLAPFAASLEASIYFAHRIYGECYLPFQRLAVVAGLAALSPSQLLIHPTYGPWFALRAVIVCAEEPPMTTRVSLPCSCADAGCVAAFEHASAHPDDWRAWLAVRDACTIGREYRYSEDQIAYHYSKDRRFLPA
jgi:methylmalonic aciduria homocystinuria type C protein